MLVFLITSCSEPLTGQANISPLQKQVYVVAIAQDVIGAHPDTIEVLEDILITDNNSVREFLEEQSNGKFILAIEPYVVQGYPTMISVIEDLDSQIDWQTKRGVIIVNAGEGGAGGHGPQAFESQDGTVVFGLVQVTDYTIFETPGRARYVLLHELSHSLISAGHANLVQSIAYDPAGDYRNNPAKAKLVCAIHFNSSDPDIRSFAPARGCPVLEYGDVFDILGDANNLFSAYSIFEKERAGFVQPTSTNTLILRKIGTSHAKIYAHDSIDPQNRLSHVKIMKGLFGFYSIEYRTQLEPFLSDNKVFIRYAFEEGGNTFLIAALSPGEQYNNSADRFSARFLNEIHNESAAYLELRIN